MRSRYSILPAPLAAALVVLSTASAHELHHGHRGPGDVPAAVVTTPPSTVTELVTRFRETGDDEYLDRALTLLDGAADPAVLSAADLLDAAFVAQARHEFSRALELTSRALAAEPRNEQAWLLLASIHLVRGNADAAADACRRLARSGPLVVLTCSARVALARGEPEPARGRLSAVLARIDASAMPAETLAWSLSVAADLSAASHPEEAVALYRRSLESTERAQVRAALVDVLLESDRLAEARAALDAGAPALPLTVRRLVVAARDGRLSALQNVVEYTERRFREWIAGEDWLHAREMARFFLDVVPEPALAARLAALNLSLQREPEDLTLARRTAAVWGQTPFSAE